MLGEAADLREARRPRESWGLRYCPTAAFDHPRLNSRDAFREGEFARGALGLLIDRCDRMRVCRAYLISLLVNCTGSITRGACKALGSEGDEAEAGCKAGHPAPPLRLLILMLMLMLLLPAHNSSPRSLRTRMIARRNKVWVCRHDLCAFGVFG